MGAPPKSNPEQPISLERFVAGKDRDSSPVFSGRVAELRWLGEEVGSMSADWRDNASLDGNMAYYEGQRVVKSMIRAGVLSRTDEASYRTPIPPFLTWLREKYPDRHRGNRNRPTGGGPPL